MNQVEHKMRGSKGETKGGCPLFIVACTNYSVAKPGGDLIAYQWDGEKTIDNNKFVTVSRLELKGSE